MRNVDLYLVQNFVYLKKNEIDLVEAVAAVANAIHSGAGGLIQGSMMEKDLRDALGLKPGEMVVMPKDSATGDA